MYIVYMIVDNIQNLEEIENDSVFLYPILRDDRLHKHHNPIVGFVIIDTATKKPYTISNGHPEGLYNSDDLSFLKDKKVYCYNMVAFKYAGYDVSNFYDTKMQYYLYTSQGYNQETPGIVNHFNRQYHNCYKINELISLYKHEEIALKIFEESFVKDIQPGLSFYQTDMLDAFLGIEKNGIRVDLPQFTQRFGNTTSRQGDYSFTEYNYYTTTGRPSNRFGGINFAALNKEDDTRNVFMSRHENGVLVELDFNSYHPRLIAELIGYDFGKDNVYEHLAKHYNNTTTPTKKDISEAKEATFRQIYGGIRKEYLHIPFFATTNDLAYMLWNDANAQGYIQSPISGRKLMLANYQDINCFTLFNYFIQMYETECNAMILKKVHKLLEDKITKPILYTYDSILFDTNEEELSYLIDTVIPKAIDIEKFPVKIKKGNTYGSLKV